ncbi:MAG: hypothetical protein FD171_1271 [Actinobacteria bacterium]|nr:MAG: hypothetical protein FD171_1271 [Actinomycetota bacterium]
MGHHTVPQEYLRGFASPAREEYVWLHARGDSEPRHVPIAKALQSRGFYRPETEVSLARDVEKPANAVLRKLAAGDSITDEERAHFTYYLAVMHERVPAARRKIDELAPEVLDRAIENTRTKLHEVADDSDIASGRLATRLSELDELHVRYREKIPKVVLEDAYEPWPGEPVLNAIYSMNWHILRTDGPQCFVTCDNPFFYFAERGIGNAHSEVTFPLTTNATLNCSWRPSADRLVFKDVTQRIVKNINRRLASHADTVVIYHEPAPWILRLLSAGSVALESFTR